METEMTDLYIIQMGFRDEVEAEMDDPSLDLESHASPSFCWTTTKLTDKKLAEIKRTAENEYVEAMGEDEDREDLNWTDGGWEEPKHGRTNRILRLRHGKGVIGMVVIQKVTLEYGFEPEKKTSR